MTATNEWESGMLESSDLLPPPAHHNDAAGIVRQAVSDGAGVSARAVEQLHRPAVRAAWSGHEDELSEEAVPPSAEAELPTASFQGSSPQESPQARACGVARSVSLNSRCLASKPVSYPPLHSRSGAGRIARRSRSSRVEARGGETARGFAFRDSEMVVRYTPPC